MQFRSSELGTSVREALRSDAQRVTALAAQLGYEVPLAHVEQHLRELGDQRTVLVAVVPRVGVVGWIGVSLARTLTSLRRADIEGLVVEDEYRGNRIGEMLLNAAETWARQQGCTNVRVLSNTIRERAHRFYERLGYENYKSEFVFRKSL